MVKKVHGRGVVTDMPRDSLAHERGTGSCSKMGIFLDPMLDRIAAKSTAPDAGEEGIFRLTAAFA